LRVRYAAGVRIIEREIRQVWQFPMIPIMVLLFALGSPQEQPQQQPSYLDELVELRQQNAKLQERVEEYESCIRVLYSMTGTPKDPKIWGAEFNKQIDADMLAQVKEHAKTGKKIVHAMCPDGMHRVLYPELYRAHAH